MQEPICGQHINPKIVNKEATQLTAPLLAKVEELNFKARQDSQKALLALYKHPAMDEARLVDAIMEIIEKKGQKPEKMPERVILGRLELMLYLSLIRAEAKQTWEWRNVVT